MKIPVVDEYIAYMKSHKSWINQERWDLINNIVLPTMKRKDVYFDERRYNDCIRYIEANWYPLFLYQKFIISQVFLFLTATKQPVYSTFFILMGRGNGKDGFVVPLGNYLQTPMNGVANYHIDLVANSEKQIKDSYNVAYNTLTENGRVKPKFKSKFSITKEEIRNYKTGSVLRFNTANANTKDGKQIGCLILNEIHAYQTYDTIGVFESAFGKVEHRREFVITTQGYVREGPLDKMLEVSQQILESGENKLKYFPFICRVESDEEVDMPEMWHKANPSLEYLPHLQEEIMQAWEEQKVFPEKRPEFITKRCNRPSMPVELQVVDYKYIKATNKPLPPIAGRPCVLGIDFSKTSDMVGACLLYANDAKTEYYALIHGWICRQSSDWTRIKAPLNDWAEAGLLTIVEDVEIDPELVFEWVSQQGVYPLRLGCDNYRWQIVKKAAEAYGFDPGSKESVLLVRPSDVMLHQPIIGSVLINERLSCGDNPLFRWALNNTKLAPAPHGNWVYEKIEPRSRKTDPFMALVHSFCVADALPESQDLPADINLGVFTY